MFKFNILLYMYNILRGIKNMIKTIVLFITGIILCSGFTSGTLEINSEKIEDESNFNEIGNKTNYNTHLNSHTVLVEYTSATWCSPCKNAHGALIELFEEGSLQFYYISLVTDKNKNANLRAGNYNVYYIPDVFFDGGYKVELGANSISQAKSAYKSNIFLSSERDVSDIDIEMNVTWLGNASMFIEVSLINNEENNYNGHLRIYITEIISSMGWRDHGDKLYSYPFLDYAFNEGISILKNDLWTDSIIWNGHEHKDGHGNNFGNIKHDNIMVIASVFNSEWHQGYADPDGTEYPFDAYYVDETKGSIITSFDNPPNKPRISGPSNGKPEIEYNYTFSASDPDGDQIYFSNE